MSDNNVNSVENIDNSKSTYIAKNQKKYNEKCKYYHIKYSLGELDDAEKLDSAISSSGMSANAFIKSAIREKLERDGFLTVGTAGSDGK